jgi:hypothetical protein
VRQRAQDGQLIVLVPHSGGPAIFRTKFGQGGDRFSQTNKGMAFAPCCCQQNCRSSGREAWFDPISRQLATARVSLKEMRTGVKLLKLAVTNV